MHKEASKQRNGDQTRSSDGNAGKCYDHGREANDLVSRHDPHLMHCGGIDRGTPSHSKDEIERGHLCKPPNSLVHRPGKAMELSEFESKHLKASVPVILPKPDNFGQGWTIKTLRERVGQSRIIVRLRTNKDFYRNGTRVAIEKTTFEKYCDELCRGTKKSKATYMAAQNIPKTFPKLMEDLPLPQYVKKKHNGEV